MLASIAELEIKLDYSVDVRISSAPLFLRSSRPAVAVPEVMPAEYDTRANERQDDDPSEGAQRLSEAIALRRPRRMTVRY
jgi:hypothetical protein